MNIGIVFALESNIMHSFLNKLCWDGFLMWCSGSVLLIIDFMMTSTRSVVLNPRVTALQSSCDCGEGVVLDSFKLNLSFGAVARTPNPQSGLPVCGVKLGGDGVGNAVFWNRD
ncbi:hypothetical protein M8J77_012245 [Diaphorina citri]|nr:hypothetical protein M8J77_012245 [Diaphorina citri]